MTNEAEKRGSARATGTLASSGIRKRSIKINDHRTSASLEEPFWDALKEIAGKSGMTMKALVTKIDNGRQQANLSSALRIYVLAYYRGQLSPKPSEVEGGTQRGGAKQ